MGIFDFFTKAKEKAKQKGLDQAAKKLVDKYAGKIIEVAKEQFSNGASTEENVKDFIKSQASAILSEQARPHIPAPLMAQADAILEIALDKMVDVVYDQIKGQIGLG